MDLLAVSKATPPIPWSACITCCPVGVCVRSHCVRLFQERWSLNRDLTLPDNAGSVWFCAYPSETHVRAVWRSAEGTNRSPKTHKMVSCKDSCSSRFSHLLCDLFTNTNDTRGVRFSTVVSAGRLWTLIHYHICQECISKTCQKLFLSSHWESCTWLALLWLNWIEKSERVD